MVKGRQNRHQRQLETSKMRSLRLFPSLRRLSSLSTEIPLRPRKENAEDEHRVFEMPPPTAPSTQPSSPPNPELDLEPNLEPESESSPPTPPSYPTDFASLLTAHPSLATHYNTLSTKASLASAKLQSRAELVKQDTLRNLGLLGRRLNEFTGYDEIERLKEGVKEKGIHFIYVYFGSSSFPFSLRSCRLTLLIFWYFPITKKNKKIKLPTYAPR